MFISPQLYESTIFSYSKVSATEKNSCNWRLFEEKSNQTVKIVIKTNIRPNNAQT